MDRLGLQFGPRLARDACRWKNLLETGDSVRRDDEKVA